MKDKTDVEDFMLDLQMLFWFGTTDINEAIKVIEKERKFIIMALCFLAISIIIISIIAAVIQYN